MSGRRTSMEQDVESESLEQDLLHGRLEDFQLHGDQLANYSESTWQHPWFPLATLSGVVLVAVYVWTICFGKGLPSTAQYSFNS